MSINIVVCIKQIIDPEIPPEQFRVDPASKRQIRGGLSLVISPYDQNALEVALQLKEKLGGNITALCLGAPEAQGAVRGAMGMGVNAGVLVSDPPLLDSDVFGVAHILAKAIQKIGVPDLVLTGCVSGDTGHKAVGPLLAQELICPCVTFVSRVEAAAEGTVRLRKRVEDGYERVEASLPLVATIVSDDSNVPRYAKLKDIMAATKKPVPIWKGIDLGLDPTRVGAGAARAQMRELVIPKQENKCEFIPGDSPEEQGERLAIRLRQLKVL
jgi:electron transfer flavoprotein beta subunit